MVSVSIILFSNGESSSRISALNEFLTKNPTPPPLMPLLFLNVNGLKPSTATSSGYLFFILCPRFPAEQPHQPLCYF
jgi:hypothetical protein